MLFRSKEIVVNLQGQIESHACTIFLSSGDDDPATRLSQLSTELKMAEVDLKKTQCDLDTTMKIIHAKDGGVNKYKSDFQTTYEEIKSFKEKLKGNMSLIQAKDIVWNEIIEVMKTIWESLIIVQE